MRTINKLTKIACVIVMFLALGPSVFAYPPDNAAVLYYQACLMYQPDKHMWDLLTDCARGDVELTEEIIKHVEEHDQVIEMVVDAAGVPYCDWGMDYSKGLDMPYPALGKMKRLAVLTLVDARMIAEEGDYELALERCLTVYEMARHISDRPLIYWLVGIAIDVKTDQCIQFILSTMPQYLEMFSWLKNKLSVIDPYPPFKSCMDYEFGMPRPYMQMEKKEELISLIPEWLDSPESEEAISIIEKLRDADEEYFDKALTYNETLKGNVISALDMAYPQAYAILLEVGNKPAKDMELGINEAVVTAILTPALNACYSIGTRGQTNFNAIRAAIGIYIIKAQTGQLPDTLPAGSPKDLFSSKDFEYEKTADGFILRCRGKDLKKDKTYEWEFKVAR